MIETTRAGLKGCAALAGLLLLTAPSLAAEVTAAGEWLVKDTVAKIRIENCAGQMWGVVSWEKEPGGIDQYNPDPGKRTRPTLGMPIVLGMAPSADKPNRWEGEIYNSQNGKTYDASITLVSADSLQLQGCVLGFLCGGETWTRTAAALPATKPAGAKPAKSGTTGAAAAPEGGATKPFDSVRDVCKTVADATGNAALAVEIPASPAPRAAAGGAKPAR